MGRIAGVGGLRQVHVAVDQTGQQPGAVELDHVVVGRGHRRADADDAITVDADVGAPEPGGVDVVDLPSHQPAHGATVGGVGRWCAVRGDARAALRVYRLLAT